MVKNSSIAEFVYVALFDYHAMESYELSFSKGEKLEISDKSGFLWKGISLVSGEEGYIPRSYVQSMLEMLQLLQFVMEKKVSLPIFHKITNNSCSNDDTVSLFLRTINDDPILLEALREDKTQHEEGKIVYRNNYCDSQYYYVILFSFMFTQSCDIYHISQNMQSQ